MSGKRWFLFITVSAVLARLAIAWTNLRPLHPDELHQTLEFTHFFLFGVMRDSQEVVGHFRNLSWPLVLSPAYGLGHLVGAGDPHVRMFAVKVFVSALNIIILWGTCRTLRYERVASSRVVALWCLFYLSVWFLMQESVRTSIEHGSAIFLWLALGLLTKQHRVAFLFAGMALVWTGIVKYPAGLLGVGALFAVALRWWRDRAYRQEVKLLWLSLGVASGLVLGGLSDFVLYGRPYESLWLYFQFNVLTGSADAIYGIFPATVYLSYFWDRLGGEALPLLMVVLAFAPVGFYRGIRELRPWAFALIFYVVGHLFPGHKEPRFMAPVFHIVLMMTVYGMWLSRSLGERLWHRVWCRRVVYGLGGILVVINIVKVLEIVRGEMWKPRMDFFWFEKVAQDKQPCALLTVHQPYAFQMLSNDADQIPLIPTASFPVGTGWEPPTQGTVATPIMWNGRKPVCGPKDQVLLHLHRQNSFWTELNCAPLTFPASWYADVGEAVTAVDKDRRAFYTCPSAVLSQFTDRHTLKGFYLVTVIPKLRSLPPWGVDQEEFRTFLHPNNFDAQSLNGDDRLVSEYWLP